MSIAIVWFRRDLRLADNAALDRACTVHGGVVPLYIHAPQEEGDWAPGAASRWWLHRSLKALDEDLRRRQGALHVRAGESLQVLLDVAERTGASAVYWNRLYEPAFVARDKQIKSALRERGIAVHSFGGALWQEPSQLLTQNEQPYRVFTPYWRKLRTLIGGGGEPLPAPLSLRAVLPQGGLPLSALNLQPRMAWDSGLRDTWQPGELGAHAALELFADDAVGTYATARDLPARHGTSRLSPHLHFGEITPRQIHHGLTQLLRKRASRRPDIEPFLRELGWREFAHYLLFHFPDTCTTNFNARFDGFAWEIATDTLLRRWQTGHTGIPLVDAGMRELWHTGWMHNRVRMVVASFLTKHLRLHWQHGARWFWDTLVDADLANNTLGWQWVAGCGADAAPFFRIFNPVTQARKFDPEGIYLRRWLPELANAPEALLYEPWKSAAWLEQSGYPAPMVDLSASRQAALMAYHASRG